eukprot:COSAG01_NODE_18981_length_1039_cov_1.858511_1_plen_76_part_10
MLKDVPAGNGHTDLFRGCGCGCGGSYYLCGLYLMPGYDLCQLCPFDLCRALCCDLCRGREAGPWRMDSARRCRCRR